MDIKTEVIEMKEAHGLFVEQASEQRFGGQRVQFFRRGGAL